MTDRQSEEPGARTRPGGGLGAPCWTQLSTSEVETAEEFYGAVLGWEFRPTELGERMRVAMRAGVPVAGLGSPPTVERTVVDWIPYFAVADVDKAAARVRERSGTLAVGPLSYPVGRGAIAADRDGARFGLWQGELVPNWPSWRAQRPWWLDLQAVDAFASAIFYGEVLDWAPDVPGSCEVAYEDDGVMLREEGRVAARIASGGGAGPGRAAAWPRWNTHFPVPDVEAAVREAVRLGGATVERWLPVSERAAMVRDPEGALFGIAREAG
ncbi:VOC family protein [uncultured Streptomyces sp.]|uniref:VOC family protein n=1 Tax=uncultured Streptomyces sp. TaxID=174707 RepID=UPI00262C40A0|nr:VOC family protein [uncultured Streptomyces sp.]